MRYSVMAKMHPVPVSETKNEVLFMLKNVPEELLGPSFTHQYFGWKGSFWKGYGCFVAALSPSGLPVYDVIFFVPHQLEIFVKEL